MTWSRAAGRAQPLWSTVTREVDNCWPTPRRAAARTSRSLYSRHSNQESPLNPSPLHLFFSSCPCVRVFTVVRSDHSKRAHSAVS